MDGAEMRLGPADLMKDWMEKNSVFQAVGKKVLGHIPTIEEFIEMTEGIILVQPQLQQVAPLAPMMSAYPFEIYVEYRAKPKDYHPIFALQLKHYESIEKVTRETLIATDKRELNNRFADLAVHRVSRMQMFYHRNAVPNTRSF